MSMDLCYFGVKEEDIPDILDGKFFEEDFQGKNERNLFIEALLGEVTISFAPGDIYSYCSCKEKVKEIANFLNKIDIKDYFEKIGNIEEITGTNFMEKDFSYLGV